MSNIVQSKEQFIYLPFILNLDKTKLNWFFFDEIELQLDF